MSVLSEMSLASCRSQEFPSSKVLWFRSWTNSSVRRALPDNSVGFSVQEGATLPRRPNATAGLPGE